MRFHLLNKVKPRINIPLTNNEPKNILKAFVAGAIACEGSVSAKGTRRLTGADAEGPFYPLADIPLTTSLFDNDDALGDPLTFSGNISNTNGESVPQLRVEIWQCDATRIYNHPGDGGYSQRDQSFRGFAAQLTDSAGWFSFNTIVPVAYGGRPPHIHVKIWRDNSELLTTQVYLEGHAGNKARKMRPVKSAGADNSYEASFNFVV